MGETYIKVEDGKEVVYEKGVFGMDRRIGELHENLDGSKETRPSVFEPSSWFETQVNVEREESGSDEREGRIGDQEGVFDKDRSFGVKTERHPSFKPREGTEEEGIIGAFIRGFTESADSTSYRSRETSKIEKPREKSQEIPTSEFLGFLAEMLGLKRMSRYFFQIAFNNYLSSGKKIGAAFTSEKIGNFEISMRYWIESGHEYRAEDIARENGLEKKLVEIYKRGGNFKKAAELAHFIGMKREAVELYETAGTISEGNLYKNITCLEEAAEIAIGLGDINEAIRLYKRGGGLGTSRYIKTDVATWSYAKHLLEKADELEKSRKKKKK